MLHMAIYNSVLKEESYQTDVFLTKTIFSKWDNYRPLVTKNGKNMYTNRWSQGGVAAMWQLPLPIFIWCIRWWLWYQGCWCLIGCLLSHIFNQIDIYYMVEATQEITDKAKYNSKLRTLYRLSHELSIITLSF